MTATGVKLATNAEYTVAVILAACAPILRRVVREIGG